MSQGGTEARMEHVNRHEQEKGDVEASPPQETGKTQPHVAAEGPSYFLLLGPWEDGETLKKLMIWREVQGFYAISPKGRVPTWGPRLLLT